MARADLTPTLIVDKNGRTTTVHKSSKRASTLPRIPAPVSGKQFRKQREAKAVQLLDRVITLTGVESARRPEKLLNLLGKTYSNRFADELESVLAEDTEEAKGVAHQIMKSESEYKIGVVRHFYQQLPGISYADVKSLVLSISYYHGRPKLDDLRDADDVTHKENLALMKVTHALHELDRERKALRLTSGNLWAVGRATDTLNGPLRFLTLDTEGNDVVCLRDKGLIELVTTQVDDTDKIVQIIRKHDLHDAVRIQAILDGIEPALADGAL